MTNVGDEWNQNVNDIQKGELKRKRHQIIKKEYMMEKKIKII